MLPAFRLSFCATGVALLCLSPVSQAQTVQPAAPAPAAAGNSLSAVTVVGNWLEAPSEEKVLEHPGARTIVERETFTESGANNVRDVLRRVPGVQVQESNGTGGSDISLNVGVRGLTSRLSPRSTILMDGVPLAVAPYGQPQLSMAPLSLGNLDAVDVVRGAAHTDCARAPGSRTAYATSAAHPHHAVASRCVVSMCEREEGVRGRRTRKELLINPFYPTETN